MPCIGQMQHSNILPAPRTLDELNDSRIWDEKIESFAAVANDLH